MYTDPDGHHPISQQEAAKLSDELRANGISEVTSQAEAAKITAIYSKYDLGVSDHGVSDIIAAYDMIKMAGNSGDSYYHNVNQKEITDRFFGNSGAFPSPTRKAPGLFDARIDSDYKDSIGLQLLLLNSEVVQSNEELANTIAYFLLTGTPINSDTAQQLQKSLSTNSFFKSIWNKEQSRRTDEHKSMLYDMIPYVNDVKTAKETISGYDTLAQRKIGNWEKAINIAMAAFDVKAAKSIKNAAKAGQQAQILKDLNKLKTGAEVKPFDIVRYGNKTSGIENHHAVLDVWAKHNIPGYIERAKDSTSIALTAGKTGQHAATKAVYREWLFLKTGKKVGGKVDWTKVTPQEIQKLSEEMMDAAKVPQAARRSYYQEFNRYIYNLKN